MSQCIALIVAAGRGTRIGGPTPKQYLPLADRPLLSYAVGTFARHPEISAVRAVIDPTDRVLYEAATSTMPVLEPVAGGESRQESVRMGLESLVPLEPARVLIHDGARPFVEAATITAVIAALERSPGAIASIPVTDTLKREDGGYAVETVPRDGLWRAQTPQGFRFGDILRAHRAATGLSLTDDAAVAEHAGLAVALVPGSERNIKVTTTADLERAEQLLAHEYVPRTGSGFDVHRFAPGDHVMLCGIAVPHDAGLIGHSDADAGLHALVDALLGAIGEGDIGIHFPPSDPQWRGADSALFVQHVTERIAALGGQIANVDITLICERPRIGAHRAAMIEKVADLLALDASAVNVKATTTEGLGFTGRREGIAAQASATVMLPRRRSAT